MLGPIRWVVWAAVRVLVTLRYWVTLKGQTEVFKHPGPYLILPNHPGYMDPPNILVRLWPAFKMRPMFLETNFESPLLAPFAWLLDGIRVPDTDRASAEARQRAEQAAGTVIETLKAGRNVIIWPSGRLQRDGVERIGGARTAADVMAAMPGVTVVLVRTRGLWGSMFGWAWGKPSLGGRLVGGIGLLLANLIVFAPRRRAIVTMEAFTAKDRPEPTRDKVNRWLEEWFNADTGGGAETPSFVPYHFLFGPRTAEFPPPPAAAELDLSKVKPETKQAIAHIVEEKIKRPLDAAENTADTTFMQLGMDSLDAMEVTLQVEQQFGFTGDVVPASIGQLWALGAGLMETAAPKPPPAGWFVPPPDPGAKPEIVGDTLPAAILNNAFRHPKQLIVADDLAGGVAYERLVVGAWAMRTPFREIAAPNVGLLLPASVAADIAFLGLHLAGKLPVLLNWTTGPANLAHAATVMGLTHVVTSKAFIDRTQVEVPGTQYVFLEDVRAGIGKVALLRRLLAVMWFPGATKARLLKRTAADPDAPAVVLFTSGSEKAPKAVPLTHANILGDQKACLAMLDVTRGDSVLGFLPMFHSFGMIVTSMLPLVTGVRVVHHPDPTDAGALVRKCAAYKPTLIAGTPTFITYILDRAKPGDLDSLRLLVLGAEKPPASLFDKVKQLIPHGEVIEGYGITECSCVISVTLPGQNQQGTIGRPIPGVSVSVTDLDTGDVLPAGKQGMLNVSGPTVFPGYIAHDGPSPFRDFGGKRWYATGDLGVIDAAGVISFAGRLKRFLKAGGEMISLPALEEPFARLYPATDKGPRVAVEGIETPDGRRIVLFTTEDVSLRDANAALQKDGFRGVMRLDEVKKLEVLPVLGTGKTDYKVLRGMIG